MRIFTAQLAYARYYWRSETVLANTLGEALTLAVGAANQSDQWSSSEVCGNTFIEAVAEGDIPDLWGEGVRHLPIPDCFTQGGTSPRITVTVSGGVVQSVTIEGGRARVLVHDYDTDGSDPNDPHLRTDAAGECYYAADWSNAIPPQGAE